MEEGRRPLRVPSPEDLRRIRERLGLDENNLPLGLSEAERQAAGNPGLPDPQWKETRMDTKPGYQTSEFWVTILAKIALVLLAYLAVAGGPVEQIATSVASGGGVAGVLAPLAKEAVLGLLGWLIHKLSVTYGENRTMLKAATLKAA